MASQWWHRIRSCRWASAWRSSCSERSRLARPAVDFVFVRVLRSPRMNRALAVLAVSAVVATGCATQGAVNQLRFDVTQVRSELADMRSTQASAGQNAGRATADVQVLDARTRELTGTVRETTDEVARLGARVAVTEEAVRTIRARVEALAPPPAPPPASPVAPPPAPAVTPPPAPPPARPATPRPAPVVAPQVERRAREPGPGAAERGYAAAMATFRAREHGQAVRSEEHTSELQSPDHLV